MNEGWVKLWRSSLDSSVFDSPIQWMVWCWCLMKATHQPYKFGLNGSDITLKPGQFICGRRQAARELPKVSEQQYRSAISFLELTHRIKVEANSKFSLVTIIKWEMYQSKSASNSEKITKYQPTDNQPITTYKNKRSNTNTDTKSTRSNERRDENRGQNTQDMRIDNILKKWKPTRESG